MKNVTINEEFLFRYFAGKASKEEIQLLSGWLDEDASNRTYFKELKNFYIETRVFVTRDPFRVRNAYHHFQERISEFEKQKVTERTRKIIVLRTRLLRYTAMFFLIFSVGLGSYFLGKGKTKSVSNDYCEIVVPYGGKSSVTLPDGSKVWLNAGSRMKYNRLFDVTSREVFLEGEAYFDVEKEKYPFVVHTSHLDIQVLGTVFNVKSYPDEDDIETTLVEGNIRILTKKSDKTILLKPKEKLTFHKRDDQSEVSPDQRQEKAEKMEPRKGVSVLVPEKLAKKMNIVENIDTEESTCWKNGTLIINKEPLESLTRKLERKFDIAFDFRSEKLQHYTYTGTLRDFPLEQVLQALKLTSPIKYTIDGKTVKLYFNENFKPLPLTKRQ
jgi:transmembrane sensor